MKSLTQQKLVIKRLLEDGEVSRNWALQNYITRLGAIICDLNADGWNIKGQWVKKNGGRDYVYKPEGEQPLKLQAFYVQGQKVAEKIIAS